VNKASANPPPCGGLTLLLVEDLTEDFLIPILGMINPKLGIIKPAAQERTDEPHKFINKINNL
jgi:hypothetical protein